MDQQEFARRWQDGQQKFYRMAWCYVKNEHDALDIVGEAAYRGLKSLHTLQEPAYFDTWMTRIVINAAIDHLRKRAAARTWRTRCWKTCRSCPGSRTWCPPWTSTPHWTPCRPGRSPASSCGF